MKHSIYRHILATVAAVVAAIGLASCDGLIYDGEGDCDPYYKVRFVYDRNMKFADAFPSEVRSVTLYVIDDRTGRVVLTRHESGEALSAPGYMMDIEVEPGTYTLVAWCGEGHRTHFGVADTDIKTGLQCSLGARKAHIPGPWGTDGSRVDDCLDYLYHGRLDAQDFPSTQGTHIYTVSLTKDTNDIHVMLQHLSGEPLDASQFTITITDENGLMDWDNSLMADERLTYFPWHTRSGTAGIDVPDYTDTEADVPGRSRAITQVSAALGELTVGRLMADRRRSSWLNIYNAEGERIVRLPYIDYFLLEKSERHRAMPDQEYLDRRDDYSMVFFLDRDNRWSKTYIHVNAWRMVVQTVDTL